MLVTMAMRELSATVDTTTDDRQSLKRSSGAYKCGGGILRRLRLYLSNFASSALTAKVELWTEEPTTALRALTDATSRAKKVYETGFLGDGTDIDLDKAFGRIKADRATEDLEFGELWVYVEANTGTLTATVNITLDARE